MLANKYIIDFACFSKTGENDFTVVPNSQFVVSRTAFKDNSSYYKINDRKAQYKEVATLLRGNGIDLDHNRFLILQARTSLCNYLAIEVKILYVFE